MTTTNFEKELEQLINKHSIENESNTPDFIIARYIMNCLQTMNILTETREGWYGRTKKDMQGVGFKDVKDCSLNKTEKLIELPEKKTLNERSILLNKSDSGLEKIIKYCSYLNTLFVHPHYFTFSLATNHHDASFPGILNEPGYASLRAGRYLANGKKLETELLFGPINSIVESHAAFRYLLDKNGDTKIDFNINQLYRIMANINDILQKDSGVNWDEFFVVPPKDCKPNDIVETK